MDEAGIMSLQPYETLAPEHLKDEVQGKGTGETCVLPVQKSEQPTSLHSSKKQKRRLHIKTVCQRMCSLLPFAAGPLDIATTLELTAHYVTYLQETLPPSLLSKINEAVEKKSSLCKNVPKPQKKFYERKTTRRNRSAAERGKPVSKKSKKDYVPARTSHKKASRRANCLPMIIPKHPTGAQMLPQVEGLTAVRAPPILLDKSTVPWGQMLPVRHDQFIPDSFWYAENSWIAPSTFMNPPPCAVTSATLSQTALPQTGPDLSSCQTSWYGSFGPVAVYPSMDLSQMCPPPEQSAAIDFSVSSEPHHTDPSGVSPSIHSTDFTPQLFTSKFQTAPSSCDGPTPPKGAREMSEVLCESRRVLERDPLADGPCEEVGSYWMDLLLESSSDNFSFPDASLVDTILSSDTMSHQ